MARVASSGNAGVTQGTLLGELEAAFASLQETQTRSGVVGFTALRGLWSWQIGSCKGHLDGNIERRQRQGACTMPGGSFLTLR